MRRERWSIAIHLLYWNAYIRIFARKINVYTSHVPVRLCGTHDFIVLLKMKYRRCDIDDPVVILRESKNLPINILIKILSFNSVKKIHIAMKKIRCDRCKNSTIRRNLI